MNRNGADFVCVMDEFVMSVCVRLCAASQTQGLLYPCRSSVPHARTLDRRERGTTGGRGDGQRQVHDNDTVRRTSIPLCFKHNTFLKGTTPL